MELLGLSKVINLIPTELELELKFEAPFRTLSIASRELTRAVKIS